MKRCQGSRIESSCNRRGGRPVSRLGERRNGESFLILVGQEVISRLYRSLAGGADLGFESAAVRLDRRLRLSLRHPVVKKLCRGSSLIVRRRDDEIARFEDRRPRTQKRGLPLPNGFSFSEALGWGSTRFTGLFGSRSKEERVLILHGANPNFVDIIRDLGFGFSRRTQKPLCH